MGTIALQWVMLWVGGFVIIQFIRPVRVGAGTVGCAVLATVVPLSMSGPTSVFPIVSLIGVILASIATTQLTVGALLSVVEIVPEDVGRSAHSEEQGVFEWACELLVTVFWLEQLGHVALWAVAAGLLQDDGGGPRVMLRILEATLLAFLPLFVLKCGSEAALSYCLKRCGRGDFSSDWRLLRVAATLLLGQTLLLIVRQAFARIEG